MYVYSRARVTFIILIFFFYILIGVFQYIFETGWILIKYWSLTDINMENGKPVYFTSEIPYPYSALPRHPVLFP